MTTPTTADLLKYADLQMAAEAFLIDPDTGKLKANLQKALTDGNTHASLFTEVQAQHFLTHWAVVDQQANTGTGFYDGQGKQPEQFDVVGDLAGNNLIRAGSAFAFARNFGASVTAGVAQ